MSNAKEKARELVYKFDDTMEFYTPQRFAKKCALVAVDEIIELRKGYFDCTNPMQDEKYWQEVKKEIENYE
jgi:hypothetical protein